MKKNGRCEPTQLPDAVHVVDTLPVGNNGKADRSAIATLAAGQG